MGRPSGLARWWGDRVDTPPAVRPRVTGTIGRALRTRTRRLVALVAVLLITATVLVAGWPRSRPAPVTEIDETITVPGGPGVSGTVSLDAGMYLPAVLPAPAVILAHGFGQSRASMADQAQQLARDGFVVLAYSARGFGASTGQIGLDSLDYEIPDARAVVDWLGRRSEVIQDGPDDPRVGVTGGSYGGALSLMLAGTDRRIDAVVAVATWNDLAQALFPNNGAAGPTADGTAAGGTAAGGTAAGGTAATPAAIADRGDGVFKRSWAATLMSSLLVGRSGTGVAAGSSGPGSSGSSSSAGAAAGCGRMMIALCQAYSGVAQTGRLTTDLGRLLARSSPAAVVGDIKAPTLLVQGEQDTLFGLDQADANARAIAAAGAPVAVSWYAGGHDGGAPDQATQDRITGWLHHYLFRSGPAPSTAFRYTVSGPVSDTGRARNRTLEVPAYPGLPAIAPSGTDPTPAAVPRTSMPLAGAAQMVLNPPGGVPAAISSLPGAGSLLSSAAGALTAAVPGQTAVFASAPVTATTVVTGSARVALWVGLRSTTSGTGAGAGGVLFVSLASTGGAASGAASSGGSGSDLGSDPADGSGSSAGAASGNSSADGTSGLGAAAASLLAGGTLAGNAVAPVRLPALPTDGTRVLVTVDLPAVAFQLQAGESLEVRVSTTDQAYAGPTAPAVYEISLAGNGAVSVPEVGGTSVSAGEEPVGVLIALIALVVIAVAGITLAGRVRGRGRPAAPDSHEHTAAAATDLAPTRPTSADRLPTDPTPQDPAPEDPTPEDPTSAVAVPAREPADVTVPLSITGLRKAYPGGVTAVDQVSFEVRPGQVLGLLGPNGAGKTTTLRMVMGLITPSAGQILVFGSEVRPGAEILSRIGSFVEGAGFLPHLSGRTNLRLYWRATGRPAEDAHFDEALQIADLGAAIDRRVKTYSHGMRQRLAIAQAMLGLPDLLILDEPTNGLDPPQIHAMREVLRRYADTGRTVLVSSHLLAEVEQTCSHVVIVNRGRTIAAGTVAEMVSASGEMVFGVADAATQGGDNGAARTSDATTGTPVPSMRSRAATILSSLDGIGAVAATNGGVQADLGSVTAGRALRALLDGGVDVTSAAPRNRLEDVFLDLVGDADQPTGATASDTPGYAAAGTSVGVTGR
jgi:ABC-2 type transport system ATP-binding protein